METILIIALLASNVWLIRKVLTKPDTAPSQSGESIPEPAPPPETEEMPDEESVVGKSTFDVNEFKEAFKEAAREVIPLIIKEYGKPSDAGLPDNPEPEHPLQIPVDKLDEVFMHNSVSELTGEEIPPESPRAGGSDFDDISTTVKVLKGQSTSPADEEVARRVLPDIEGTQIIEKIRLDPVVRKKILMIECRLPQTPVTENAPASTEQSLSPAKKIVFHADIDTTDVDSVDFNIFH